MPADGGGGRLPLDGYYTPSQLAGILFEWLVLDGFYTGGSVLEPSAGRGAFVRAALAVPGTGAITARDIDPARVTELSREFEGHPRVSVQEGDFLALQEAKPFDLIVGNPPFSAAEAHVRRALAMRAPGGTLAFLLRLAFFESDERVDFWREQPASKVYVLSQRPSFTGGGTDNAAYGVFVWAREHVGPTTLHVVSWRAPKRRKARAAEVVVPELAPEIGEYPQPTVHVSDADLLAFLNGGRGLRVEAEQLPQWTAEQRDEAVRWVLLPLCARPRFLFVYAVASEGSK